MSDCLCALSERLDGFIIMRKTGAIHCIAVDRDDFARVDAAGPWAVVSRGPELYAYSQRVGYLHRFLLGLQRGERREVDHVDGHGLNNTRNNLRTASHAENCQNTKSRGTSKLRGVYWDARNGKWGARVKRAGIQYFVGRFTDEKAAGLAAQEMRARLLTHNNESRHPVVDDVR